MIRADAPAAIRYDYVIVFATLRLGRYAKLVPACAHNSSVRVNLHGPRPDAILQSIVLRRFRTVLILATHYDQLVMTKFAYKANPRIIIMTSWAKDTTEFTVSVTRNVKAKTSFSYIPKPILDMLGTPSRITFVLQDGLIVVRAGDEKS